MSDTHALIDAQFDRAVEIVQGLPKTGPIQTGYEEKLAMYSLYKQATTGNVKPPRPGMWDMLGRAKWDAWAKQKDLDPYEAKWLYVETLQKVLRKYSDKTVARDLVRELEGYAGDSSNVVMSGSFAKSSRESANRSTSSSEEEDEAENRRDNHPPSQSQEQGFGSYPSTLPSYQSQSRANAHRQQPIEESTSDEEATSDEDNASPAALQPRPHSAVSSNRRYRTPVGGQSAGIPTPFSPTGLPPLPSNVPLSQPLPRYATPSIFSPPTGSSPIPSGSYPPSASISYPPNLPSSYQGTTQFRAVQGQNQALGLQQHEPWNNNGSGSQGQRTPLERAVESVQASLAALRERIEMIESFHYSGPLPSAGGGAGGHTRNQSLASQHPSFRNGGGSQHQQQPWDPSNMGAWSLLLRPLSRIYNQLHYLRDFLGSPHNISSPILVVVRRLLLDASFVMFVLMLLKWVWRRTGIRRREVLRALGGVWRALVGPGASGGGGRVMVNRGV